MIAAQQASEETIMNFKRKLQGAKVGVATNHFQKYTQRNVFLLLFCCCFKSRVEGSSRALREKQDTIQQLRLEVRPPSTPKPSPTHPASPLDVLDRIHEKVWPNRYRSGVTA
mmetsp:Transcript_8270/g.16769  ORF Transcript_8270/g.16769 Transcript_8270/m.16769 type:complete len:112 (+) Transcript_8270:234-569(+)